ncbi:phage integrase family site specific recombinase [Spirochaetia bacterium]|nr:phage integrase family site specific recombinase [Spirochaetia bacterium]
MGVKVREKRGKLYLDIYQNGKRTWEALNLAITHDKAQNKEIYRMADICRSKRETQLLTGAWNIADPISARITLVDYILEFSKIYKKPDIVKCCIKHIKNYGAASILLSQVTSKWVDNFQNYLLNDAGLSHCSAGNYSRILRSALKKAVANNLIIKDPAEIVQKITRLENELIFLSFEELKQLSNVIPDNLFTQEVRRAFIFACYTGLRVSDLETITWSRIEKNPMQIIKKQEKTRNPVYVPLNKTAREIIVDGKNHAPDEKLFSLGDRNRRTTYVHLNKWAKDANISKPIGWHTARRTFATMALENGVDIYTVAKLLGHVGVASIAKYAKATDKLKRKAIASLPEL